jgi:hypothetical protein
MMSKRAAAPTTLRKRRREKETSKKETSGKGKHEQTAIASEAKVKRRWIARGGAMVTRATGNGAATKPPNATRDDADRANAD